MHREGERQILAQSCTGDEVKAAAVAAAESAAKALWTFLDGVHEAYALGGASS